MYQLETLLRFKSTAFYRVHTLLIKLLIELRKTRSQKSPDETIRGPAGATALIMTYRFDLWEPCRKRLRQFAHADRSESSQDSTEAQAGSPVEVVIPPTQQESPDSPPQSN